MFLPLRQFSLGLLDQEYEATEVDQKLGDDGQNGVHVEYVGQRTDLGEGGERLWRCVNCFLFL